MIETTLKAAMRIKLVSTVKSLSLVPGLQEEK